VSGALVRYVRSFTGFGRNARLFLVTTIVFGAAVGLYWADFNLYLEKIGVDRGTIGLLMAVSQLAAVLVSFPCGAISNRLGRRTVMAGGMVLVALGLFVVLPGDRALLFVGVIGLGAGSQAVYVVQVPYIAEQTKPDERNEYFAIWSAIGNLTYLFATLLGGFVADDLANRLGLGGGPAPYRLLLTGTAILALLSVATTGLMSSDRPAATDHSAEGVGGRLGIVIHDKGLFFRLLLPGFITALGAGQLIPFLNLFVQHKFALDLPAVNAILAVTSLGTTIAILVQPALARRFGRIGSIVLVQGASIPFLVVLGFSPMLWTVIVAMAVRNSLMNAGSPIFDAFAMERVSAAERATLSAGMTLLWSLGWTVAPLYYGILQDRLGFTAGYTVNFVTIIVLYTLATSLLWHWFRAADHLPARELTPEAVVEVERALAEGATAVPDRA
jgi:MFS family permease